MNNFFFVEKERGEEYIRRGEVNCIIIMREQEFLIKHIGINCRKFIEKFHSWLMDGSTCTHSDGNIAKHK